MQRSAEKRKKHSTLLSRLKARSKTAPLLFTSDEVPTDPSLDVPKAFFANQKTAPGVIRDTWTAPALVSLETTTGPTAHQNIITEGIPSQNSSPSLLSHRSNMQGLPALPKSRVILPPLRRES